MVLKTSPAHLFQREMKTSFLQKHWLEGGGGRGAKLGNERNEGVLCEQTLSFLHDAYLVYDVTFSLFSMHFVLLQEAELWAFLILMLYI